MHFYYLYSEGAFFIDVNLTESICDDIIDE